MYTIVVGKLVKRILVGVAIILLLLLFSATVRAGIVCGDIDGNGEGPDIADITYLISYQYFHGPRPPVWGACDLDGDGYSDIYDLTCLVDRLYVSMKPLTCQTEFHSDMTSACLSHSTARLGYGWTSSGKCLGTTVSASYGERMEAKFVGSELRVYHKYALYNCCLKYNVSWNIQGENIVVTEIDTSGSPCNCVCYFNLTAVQSMTLPNTVSRYIVTLIGIGGNTVGVDTLYMGALGYFTADVIGADIYLYHLNADMNCCGLFAVDYSFDGNTIIAQEKDTTKMPCMCDCPFDVTSILRSVAPGTYSVVLLGPPTMTPSHDTIGIDTVTVVDTMTPPGGPCFYKVYEGTAVIHEITTPAPGSLNCANAREVLMEFIPTDTLVRNSYMYPAISDKYPKLTVGEGMNPSAAWLTAKGITVGARFPAERHERTMGTCTPVGFVLPTVDMTDWAGYCF